MRLLPIFEKSLYSKNEKMKSYDKLKEATNSVLILNKYIDFYTIFPMALFLLITIILIILLLYFIGDIILCISLFKCFKINTVKVRKYR